jgi:hypothetical protein
MHMKKNNEVTMGSTIIDLYMDGFAEGKNDDVEIVEHASQHSKKRSDKERASARRKKAYFKSKSRMAQLRSVAAYTPSPECQSVVQGMLRSHQLPIAATVRYENPCGSSIGNKKRMDASDIRMKEHMQNDENCEESFA